MILLYTLSVTVDHLFFSCPVAMAILQYLLYVLFYIPIAPAREMYRLEEAISSIRRCIQFSRQLPVRRVFLMSMRVTLASPCFFMHWCCRRSPSFLLGSLSFLFFYFTSSGFIVLLFCSPICNGWTPLFFLGDWEWEWEDRDRN